MQEGLVAAAGVSRKEMEVGLKERQNGRKEIGIVSAGSQIIPNNH